MQREEDRMTTMEGGCLCGKVRYAISAEPVFTGVCHCKNCQKSNGSAFSVVVAVPIPALSVTGALKTYVGRGDSGQETRRRFCPECGSPIASEAAVMPGIAMVEVGTLDDPSAVKPAMHIYCRSKLDWMVIPEGVGAFPAMPPPG
jgi:hypothetical protein